MNSKSVSIRLSEEKHREVKEAADVKGLTINQYCKMATYQLINRDKKNKAASLKPRSIEQ